MKTIAFIPARCGSKAIPFKNIKLFCGKPLIYWNLEALQQSDIDKVIVATDCQKIKSVVKSFSFSKVEIYNRDATNAEDTSSTESVMLEYIQKQQLADEQLFMLVQLTSPFTTAKDFNAGLQLLEKHDAVLSAVRSKRFYWNTDGTPINYNFNKRPRRQEFDGVMLENGAFYLSTVQSIKKAKNRISGNIGIYEMPEYTGVEIDEASDWTIAEAIMKKHQEEKHLMIDFSRIKLFLTDVDGVMTDAGMYYTENGDEFKKFCTYDGMALQLLQKQGLKVGMLTTEDKQLNRRRARKLKLDYDFHGVKDKLSLAKKVCEELNISLLEMAYIGDDVNCLELLSNVGLAACPANAMPEIKAIPGIIQLKKKGGEGAVREFVQKMLK